MITLKNLSKSYGFKCVLKNINIEFKEGMVYGIMGENGAGKTTLFRCIADLENFEGIVESDLSPLKDHLGFLFTEPYFFTKITGIEYIRLLCNARKKEVTNIKDKNIFELPLNDYVSTYSSGMKKKLALFAVLLQQNQYYVLDEPFNGVDIHSNIIIVELIKKLKTSGKTVIISSHIFSTLSDTCDEIHLMKHGEIVKMVTSEGFNSLEREMKEYTIENKIDKLNL